MLRLYLTILTFGVLLPCLYAKRSMFYRKDYTYIEEYDAFYKMHWDVSWDSAFKICDDEGAQLFYPKVKDEWTVAQKLSQNSKKRPNVSDMFLGLHNQFQLGEFITIDGFKFDSITSTVKLMNIFVGRGLGVFIESQSTESLLGLQNSIYPSDNCVIMNIITGNNTIDKCQLRNPILFICKKEEDVSCPTIDHEYKYVKQLNKCYKAHKKQMDWNGAMRTCYMEGGLLALLETDSEINATLPLVASDVFYFVGFRKLFNSNEFYTVKGKIFENSYFRKWYRPENQEGRDCGSFYYYQNDNRYLLTVNNCSDNNQFICEMDLK